MMSALIGVVMGFIAFTVDGLIDKLNAFKFGTVTSLIQNGVSAFPSWVAFICLSCFLAACAGGLVSFIEPLAAGSGIPELKTYLNGVHLRGLLRQGGY
jgi:chloride channel 7